jgi:methylmalonyl-CoA/ethylmalonyl-CoA epimerase
MTALTGLTLLVPDAAAGRRLYVDGLGGQPRGAWTVDFAPGLRVDLRPAGGGRLGPVALEFVTDDLDTAAGRLAARPGGSPRVVVRDGVPELRLPPASAYGAWVRLREAPAPPAQPPGRGLVEEVDHVCVGVDDLEDAIALFGDALGGRVVFAGFSPLGLRCVQIGYPHGGKLELLSPHGTSSALHKFIQRRGGSGIHHMTVRTRDVERAAEQLEARGFAVVDTNLAPKTWKETFIRPAATMGLLIQVAWTTVRHTEPLPPEVLADALAGRYDVRHNVMTPIPAGDAAASPS